MSYDYIFILKRLDKYTWRVTTEKGLNMYNIINCSSKNEAEERARCWMSSWRSAFLKIEDENSN